jgi:hypothetical protein
MKPADYNDSRSSEVIDSVYINGNGISGYYKKEVLYHFLILFPGSIRVNIPPFPLCVPVGGGKGKHIRSYPDSTALNDNLLDLPRE